MLVRENDRSTIFAIYFADVTFISTDDSTPLKCFYFLLFSFYYQRSLRTSDRITVFYNGAEPMLSDFITGQAPRTFAHDSYEDQTNLFGGSIWCIMFFQFPEDR